MTDLKIQENFKSAKFTQPKLIFVNTNIHPVGVKVYLLFDKTLKHCLNSIVKILAILGIRLFNRPLPRGVYISYETYCSTHQRW